MYMSMSTWVHEYDMHSCRPSSNSSIPAFLAFSLLAMAASSARYKYAVIVSIKRPHSDKADCEIATWGPYFHTLHFAQQFKKTVARLTFRQVEAYGAVQINVMYRDAATCAVTGSENAVAQPLP